MIFPNLNRARSIRRLPDRNELRLGPRRGQEASGGGSHLLGGELDAEGEVHRGEHHRRILLRLAVKHELTQRLVHDRVEEGEVVPADLAAEQLLDDVSVEEEWTHLVLEETQPDDTTTGGDTSRFGGDAVR